jgi:hypothetical protein
MSIRALLVSCNVILLAAFAAWLWLLSDFVPQRNGAGVGTETAEACFASHGVPKLNGWTGNIEGCEWPKGAK